MFYFIFLFIFIVQFLLPAVPELSRHFFWNQYVSVSLLLVSLITIGAIAHEFKVALTRVKELGREAGYFVLPLLLLWSGNFVYVSLPASADFGVGIAKLVFGLVISGLIAVSLAALKETGTPAAYRYNFLYTITILAYFLGLYAVTNFYWLFPNLLTLVAYTISVFGLSWLIFYELFWLKGKGDQRSVGYIATLSFIAAELAYAHSFWMTRYKFAYLDPAGEQIIGVPLAALTILIVVGYFAWGLVHHRLSKTLTRRIFWEYFVISVTMIAVVYLTTAWLN